jgi:hypothetical protein
MSKLGALLHVSPFQSAPTQDRIKNINLFQESRLKSDDFRRLFYAYQTQWPFWTIICATQMQRLKMGNKTATTTCSRKCMISILYVAYTPWAHNSFRIKCRGNCRFDFPLEAIFCPATLIYLGVIIDHRMPAALATHRASDYFRDGCLVDGCIIAGNDRQCNFTPASCKMVGMGMLEQPLSCNYFATMHIRREGRDWGFIVQPKCKAWKRPKCCCHYI